VIGEESPALGFSQHSALRNPSPARVNIGAGSDIAVAQRVHVERNVS